MNRLEESTKGLNQLIQQQDEYDFGEFISALRENLGISRRKAAEELKLHYLKLYYLELGCCNKEPEEEIISKLSEYYAVPEKVMKEKVLTQPRKDRKA